MRFLDNTVNVDCHFVSSTKRVKVGSNSFLLVSYGLFLEQKVSFLPSSLHTWHLIKCPCPLRNEAMTFVCNMLENNPLWYLKYNQILTLESENGWPFGHSWE